MKKILLINLVLIIGLISNPLLSQHSEKHYIKYKRQNVHPDHVSNYSESMIGQKMYDNSIIGTTWYDSQTVNYGNVMPRVWIYDDGTIGATWMNAGEGAANPERGAAYNYFDGSEWGTATPHVGPPDRHGWPNYAKWGATGEIISVYKYVSGEGPILLFKRDVKGEGSWEETSLNGPSGTSIVWHSMMTSGPNNEYIHILAYTYDQPVQGLDNALLYYRSNDGGETWDIDGVIIDGLGAEDLVTINSLSYNWANPVGNTIGFTYGFDEWGGWFFKSIDNGDSWEKITVMETPFDPFDPPENTDIFGAGIGSSSCVIDSEGKGHVVFNRMLQVWTDGEWGYYPLNTDGLIYWNEDMNPLDTGIISSTGLDNLMDGGYLCSYIFGYDPSVGVEIPEGQPNYANSLCGFPVMTIDDEDNLFVASSNFAPDYITYDHNFRHIIANSSFDGGDTWNGMIDLNEDIQFIFSECAYPVMPPMVYDNIYVLFQEDFFPGTFEWPNEQTEATLNNMYFMDVPKSVFVNIDEKKVKPAFEISEFYPNPAQFNMHFSINLKNKANVKIELLNMLGQKTRSYNKGCLTSGKHKISLDISKLSTGIYSCIIFADEQRICKKLIVR